MTNSTVTSDQGTAHANGQDPALRAAAPAKAPAERKVDYRTGKRSVSGWIRADLVQYAEEVAHAKGRSLQSVLQDALESLKVQEEAPPPAPSPEISHITIQNKDQDREMSVTVRVCGHREGVQVDEQRGFAIDFDRGVAVAYLGDGTEKTLRLPARMPEGP